MTTVGQKVKDDILPQSSEFMYVTVKVIYILLEYNSYATNAGLIMKSDLSWTYCNIVDIKWVFMNIKNGERYTTDVNVCRRDQEIKNVVSGNFQCAANIPTSKYWICPMFLSNVWLGFFKYKNKSYQTNKKGQALLVLKTLIIIFFDVKMYQFSPRFSYAIVWTLNRSLSETFNITRFSDHLPIYNLSIPTFDYPQMLERRYSNNQPMQ
ncbi:uncharacterized protein EV154DRAFT_485967 [Mucor mucedo]|uniref:uncharacterized protein n=1 Tax=Mucor mucedo TaxID=29922 RepID=UPI00221E491E|nr:uncharacterized protein EV154DRAFT_485967 [Mucor mucedo]KAI7880012.1 hypothetical protein EV154DRAFT_485967 [Mucor mucedo]